MNRSSHHVTDAMVERAARAMFITEHGEERWGGPDGHDGNLIHYRRIARAALSAALTKDGAE